MWPWVCSVKDNRTSQNMVRTSETSHVLFLPHFDFICDLLQNRCMATGNLFVKQVIYLSLSSPVSSRTQAYAKEAFPAFLLSISYVFQLRKGYLCEIYIVRTSRPKICNGSSTWLKSDTPTTHFKSAHTWRNAGPARLKNELLLTGY